MASNDKGLNVVTFSVVGFAAAVIVYEIVALYLLVRRTGTDQDINIDDVAEATGSAIMWVLLSVIVMVTALIMRVVLKRKMRNAE